VYKKTVSSLSMPGNKQLFSFNISLLSSPAFGMSFSLNLITKATIMKKIITLLFMSGAFVTSFAQSRTIDKAKEVITKEPRTTTNDRKVYGESDTRYPTNSTSRQAEIDEINRTYDAKIKAVRVNPLISAAEKERRIRDLEYERAQRIREINNRYYGNTGTSGKNNKNKAYKTNNGKHLGWEKGKGNPHRTGGPVKGNGNGKGKGKNK
jgi:hypothetical protein